VSADVSSVEEIYLTKSLIYTNISNKVIR